MQAVNNKRIHKTRTRNVFLLNVLMRVGKSAIILKFIQDMGHLYKRRVIVVAGQPQGYSRLLMEVDGIGPVEVYADTDVDKIENPSTVDLMVYDDF